MNIYYVNKFIDEFCEQNYVSKKVLFSKDRSRILVDKRMVLAFFLRHRTDLTWTEIGKIMNRHHASMIHYVNNVEELMTVYPHIKRMVENTNILFLEYQALINNKNNTNMYTDLLTENEKLKERIERNHNLIIELIKLEKNGTKNKKQKDQYRRTEV